MTRKLARRVRIFLSLGVASPDRILGAEGGTIGELETGFASLLANDTEPDLPDDTLTVNPTPVSGPSFGTLRLNEDGPFSYTHDGSENFSDRFIYEVQDAVGATDTATVEITINS